MRIFGLEITRRPKRDLTVWVRAGNTPLGMLLSEMTPDELRSELKWIITELNKGNTLQVGPRDQFKRVLSFQQPINYYQD